MSYLRKQKEIRRERRKLKRMRQREAKTTALAPFVQEQKRQTHILSDKGQVCNCSKCGSNDQRTQSYFCLDCQVFNFYFFCGDCGFNGDLNHGLLNVHEAAAYWNKANGFSQSIDPPESVH